MSSLHSACHYLTATYEPLTQTEKKSFSTLASVYPERKKRGKVEEIESVIYSDVISVPLPLFHCVLVAFPITDHFSRQKRATWDLVMIL